MLPATVDRVQRHTSPEAAERIAELLRDSVRYHAAHPEDIPRRLRELDREWDVERALATSSASVTLLGLVLGTTVNRKWLVLSAAAQGFFLQHALQGWCPPLPLFRNLGIRTAQEIETERYALIDLLRQAALRDEITATDGA